MVREIISFQLGQCGNQVGFEFWKKLCVDHGIDKNGSIRENAHVGDDLKESFFYQQENGNYVPRTLLIDTEPRVLNKVYQSEYQPLFNIRSRIMPDGAGAGNIWTKGYESGKLINEEISEAIETELEISDNPQGFFVFHSVAGGTGSGMGSYLVERLAEDYPKMALQTYSVFPNTMETSDVVVQPYNTILTISALLEFADSVIVLDNSALNRTARERLNKLNPGLDQINHIISCAIRDSTATLRYPGYINYGLQSLFGLLFMSPLAKFVVTSCSAFSEQTVERDSNTSIYSLLHIMRKLLTSKSMLATIDIQNGRYISAVNMLRGEVDPEEIHKCLMKIKERSLMKFVEWVPSDIMVIHSNSGPYQRKAPKTSGVMLSNHTGIRSLFENLVSQFNTLYKKNAFLDQYKRESRGGECDYTFCKARDSVQKLLEEYDHIEKWTPDSGMIRF